LITGDTAMGMGRPKAELTLSTAEQEQLTSFARSRSMPAALSLRARIVLACAAGQSNTEVARRFESTNATVGKWRRRFVKDRISGLYDEVRPGKPRSIDDDRIAALIHNAAQEAKGRIDSLERTHSSGRQRNLEEQRTALFPAFRTQAASNKELQAVE
jgi:hypothetical protein